MSLYPHRPCHCDECSEIRARRDRENSSRPAVIEQVIVHEGVAYIVGMPGIYGWLAEDDEHQHNCDQMGCASAGPHVLARIVTTKLVSMDQLMEARRAHSAGEKL